MDVTSEFCYNCARINLLRRKSRNLEKRFKKNDGQTNKGDRRYSKQSEREALGIGFNLLLTDFARKVSKFR